MQNIFSLDTPLEFSHRKKSTLDFLKHNCGGPVRWGKQPLLPVTQLITQLNCSRKFWCSRTSGTLLTCKNFKKTHKSCSSLKASQFLGAGLVTERNFEKKCIILTNSILQNNYVLTEYFHLTKQPKTFLHQGIADKHFTNTFFFNAQKFKK